MPDEKKPKKDDAGAAPERVVFGRELTADQIADAVVEMVNKERARRGLPPMEK